MHRLSTIARRTTLSQFSTMASGEQRMRKSNHELYQHAKTGGFHQTPPALHNPYKDDPILDRALKRMLSSNDYERIRADLTKFGDRVVDQIDHLGRQAELNEPKLEQQNAWGERTDKLIVCDEWNQLKGICAEEGLINIGYDKTNGMLVGRLHQLAKIYLFSPSAGLVTCPMAMTDGAVKTITSLGMYGKHKLATEAVDRLKSRDPANAWTSGQWMTEKRGGSDVAGGCDTYAVQMDNGKYRLHGYKWFSSAIDADVALTLARIVDSDGNAVDGSRGLSLFLLRIRDENGKLNGIQMVRLKNKMGTKQLPTAELLLDGTIAEKIGETGRGVAGIANMLNITRIHNAIASIGFMRRVIALARDYSTKRVVFSRKQAEWPLHTATMAKLEVETRGCMLLLLESARLLGLSEDNKSTDVEQMLLRLITPVLKLYAGKLSVPLISEGIECFGGQGYMEDTGLPTLLRDAQVTPIWEGTTNVLSMDVLRVFGSKQNILMALGKRVEELLEGKMDEKLEKAKKQVMKGLEELEMILHKASKSQLHVDSVARNISFGIARIYAGSLLIDFARDGNVSTASDVDVAYRWCCEQKLVDIDVEWMKGERIEQDRSIVFQSFSKL